MALTSKKNTYMLLSTGSHRIVSSLTIFFQNLQKDDVYLLCSETKRKHWKRKQSPAIRKYLNNHATSCITCNALFKQSKQGILTKVNFKWRPLLTDWFSYFLPIWKIIGAFTQLKSNMPAQKVEHMLGKWKH